MYFIITAFLFVCLLYSCECQKAHYRPPGSSRGMDRAEFFQSLQKLYPQCDPNRNPLARYCPSYFYNDDDRGEPNQPMPLEPNNCNDLGNPWLPQGPYRALLVTPKGKRKYLRNRKTPNRPCKPAFTRGTGKVPIPAPNKAHPGHRSSNFIYGNKDTSSDESFEPYDAIIIRGDAKLVDDAIIIGDSDESSDDSDDEDINNNKSKNSDDSDEEESAYRTLNTKARSLKNRRIDNVKRKNTEMASSELSKKMEAVYDVVKMQKPLCSPENLEEYERIVEPIIGERPSNRKSPPDLKISPETLRSLVPLCFTEDTVMDSLKKHMPHGRQKNSKKQ